MEVDYSKVPQVKLSYVDEVCNDRLKVRYPHEGVEVFRECFKECMQHHEEIYIMYLNCSNRVLGLLCVGKGTIDSTLGNIKAIAQGAILSNASKVMIAHNHPSGNKEPSNADKTLTAKLNDMFRLLEIRFLDHFIITYDGYLSFSEEGLL